ncbi:MAG: hypothetical protein VSS75_014960 [Candidatus Parabeggiatoa sp.]|nr:hypothetical protein [Candidatus Parabeggiatoa sp.]
MNNPCRYEQSLSLEVAGKKCAQIGFPRDVNDVKEKGYIDL